MAKSGSIGQNRRENGGATAKQTGGRAVTMAIVGRMAGVSQVTVSRALSDPSKVSPATLEKIRHAVEATGFVPNAVAGALASRKSRLVTALVPSITNIVYSAMITAFAGELGGHGYQVLLSETGFDPEEEEKLVVTHLSRRPDAMLLTGIQHTAETRKMLLAADIPVVELWDITESPIDQCVGFSHVEAGRAMAEFAIEGGYRNAATISAGDERARRRRDAFAKEFSRRAGGEVAQINLDGAATLASGRAALQDLLEQKRFEHGLIFCSSDLLAHGVIIEANVRGLSIPNQIAVAGFGDQDFAAHVVPAITTVRVDRAKLGFTAANALLARFAGEQKSEKVADLGFEIIGRDSA